MNYVYLLRCADGSLYCGWTTDPAARIAAHNSGKGAKYTRSRRPVTLAYMEVYEDRHEALSREWHIKRMSRAEKEKLIGHEYTARNSTGDPVPPENRGDPDHGRRGNHRPGAAAHAGGGDPEDSGEQKNLD